MADKVYGDRTVSEDPRYRYIRVNDGETVSIPRSYEGRSGDYYQEYTTPIAQAQDRFKRGAYDQFVFGKNTGPLSSEGVNDLLNVTTPIITHEPNDRSYGYFRNEDARNIYGDNYLPGGNPVKIPKINLSPNATGHTVDHELGHNVDALLNHDFIQSGRSTGFEKAGQPTWTHSGSEPVPGQVGPEVSDYLDSVGQARSGSTDKTGQEILDLYRPSHRLTEGWADAMTRMIRDPVGLHQSDPKLYEYMKQRINTDPKLQEIIKISKLQQLGQVPQYADDGGMITEQGGNDMPHTDNRKPSKVTKKDRYGNSVTMEYAPEMKPLDPTALAKHAMEQNMGVPEISMTSMEPPMMDHPGGPKGSDTVPAWLTPGEFVVNAEAMRIPGAKEQIESINDQGRAQQKMQGGSIPSGYNHGGAVDMTGPISQPYGMGYMLGGNVEGAGQPPIAGYQQGGMIPAPFIAGPRLNEPKYQDDGGQIENPYQLTAAQELLSQLTGVGQLRGVTQNDVWKKSPEQIARDNAPWWESNPDLFKDDGGWVTDALLDRLAEVESGGDNEAVSPVGAIGKYQWLPSSAKQAGYGVKPFNPKDPKAARAATKKYLENMQKHHGFTPEETLRAYNWGPGNVLNFNRGKRKDIPDEALNYPGKILGIENTQGVTPPPGEAPALPTSRPGQQYDRLSDIPKQDLPRYVEPAGENIPTPTPRPVQLTAQDIDDLDADINYADKGGRIGSIKSILKDPTLIPRLIEAGQKAAPLFAEEGAEVPIQSNFLDRVHGQGNTSQADTPDNVVPALQNVPQNPMYANDKPVDFGEEVPELDAFGDEGQAVPSEYWRSKYDETHPDFIPQHGKGKTESDKRALDRAQELLDQADPSDPMFDAKLQNVANLKKTVVESEGKDAAIKSANALKEKTLDADKKAAMQTKKEMLADQAVKAIQNGEHEKAQLIEEQIFKLEQKELVTPDSDEKETKTDKKGQVLNKIAKGLETVKDPELDKKNDTEIEEAGKKSSPAEVEKTAGLFQELFGDLFDKKELARMAVTYLGGRLLGGSHQGSLKYSTKAYLTRVDSKNATKASNAAAFTKTGKYTPASVAAYAKSGDLADLQAVGAKYQPTGTTETRTINGQKVSVQQVKGSDGTIGYQVGNKVLTKAQLENGSKPYDPSFDKSTSEYRTRRSRATKSAAGVFEEIFKRDDRYRIGENEWKQNTKIGSQKAAHEFWSWAEEEGLDPESDETLNLLGNAYAQAIQDGKGGKFKPRSLTQYLRQQAIREKSGAPELFQTGSGEDGAPTYVRGDKMAIVDNNISHIIQSKGLSLKPDAFYQKAISEWNKLGPDGQKLYNKSAESGETGFYVYLNKNLADIAK